METLGEGYGVCRELLLMAFGDSVSTTTKYSGRLFLGVCLHFLARRVVSSDRERQILTDKVLLISLHTHSHARRCDPTAKALETS